MTESSLSSLPAIFLDIGPDSPQYWLRTPTGSSVCPPFPASSGEPPTPRIVPRSCAFAAKRKRWNKSPRSWAFPASVCRRSSPRNRASERPMSRHAWFDNERADAAENSICEIHGGDPVLDALIAYEESDKSLPYSAFWFYQTVSSLWLRGERTGIKHKNNLRTKKLRKVKK